tara:strand:+ start:2240 stop:3208 length:969 start_codon:yes stop_codon:yes gene_type:complete
MKFIKKNDLSKIVFVSGSTRSGKIILSRIISSLKRSENITVDHLIEQLPIMTRLGELSNEACITLLKYAVHLRTYDNFIGRNTNFKTTDFTSIFKTENPKKYFRRLISNKDIYGDSNEGDTAIKNIKKENILFNMMIHYELMHVDIFLRAFPKSKFYCMERHPIDLVYSWINKKYSSTFLENPRNATITYKYKNKIVPYYAFGWEEKYIKSNYVDKIIFMIENSTKVSKQKYNKLSELNKKKVKKISFDKLVLDPEKIINKICIDLKTEKTGYTNKILEEENCPRELDIKIRDKKMEKIKKKSSNEGFNVLKRLSRDFDRKG